MGAFTLNDAKHLLQVVSNVLGGSPIPAPFKSAVNAIPKIALGIIEMVEGTGKNKKDLEGLALYIANLSNAIVRALTVKGGRQVTPEMEIGVEALVRELQDVSDDIKGLKSRSPLVRHVKFADDANKVTTFKERISQAIRLLELEDILSILFTVQEMKQEQIEQGELQLIERLGTGDSGSGDKERACLEGTRENLLRDLEAWATDSETNEKRILWLTGPAGTGKSAVVATMEGLLKEKGQLGAIFYFVREQPARNKLAILEIARRLAFHQPALRAKIVDALKADRDIRHILFTEQYRLLLEEPLSSLHAEHPPLTIIFDALDECEKKYITEVLQRIVKTMANFPPRVRFIFSSRVETYLQAVLESSELKSKIKHCPLDRERLDEVTHDIQIYLSQQLSLVAREFEIADVDWPGPEKVNTLAGMAGGFFIWAATIVAVVADEDERDPESQIEHVLKSPSLSHLDGLYSSILDRAFTAKANPKVLQLLRSVLGALVTAQESLDTTALAALVGSSAEEIRRKVLNYLQAVLLVPRDNTSHLRFVHQSFVDFVTTSQTCDPRFLIQTADHHQQMVLACFRSLKDLRKNMCNLQPWEMNNDITDLEHCIDTNMSQALRYACRYWDAHLMKSTTGCEEVYEALRSFAYERMLFWLEALSLMGKTLEAVHMARNAETWIADNKPHSDAITENISILRDFQRFVNLYRNAISESAIHIYISALPLVPVDSALWKVYSKQNLGGPQVTYRRGRLLHWPPGLWTGTGHTKSIMCLAFSPDGRTIVSGSFDQTLRLWDASSGAAIGKPLEGHTSWIECLAFSPDGRTIVSRDSRYRTITWDVALHKQADISIPREQSDLLLVSSLKGANSTFKASHSGWITSSVTNRRVFWRPDTGEWTPLTVHGNVCAIGAGVVPVVDLSECYHTWSLSEIDRTA